MYHNSLEAELNRKLAEIRNRVALLDNAHFKDDRASELRGLITDARRKTIAAHIMHSNAKLAALERELTQEQLIRDERSNLHRTAFIRWSVKLALTALARNRAGRLRPVAAADRRANNGVSVLPSLLAHCSTRRVMRPQRARRTRKARSSKRSSNTPTTGNAFQRPAQYARRKAHHGVTRASRTFRALLAASRLAGEKEGSSGHLRRSESDRQ